MTSKAGVILQQNEFRCDIRGTALAYTVHGPMTELALLCLAAPSRVGLVGYGLTLAGPAKGEGFVGQTAAQADQPVSL